MELMEDLGVFKDKGNIGIVGGSGRMGQWALLLFKKLGYKNLFYNGRQRNPEVEELTGAKFIESKKEIAEISDWLIISVPISKTLDVIDEIGPHIKEKTIFSDFTSIKKEPCERMAKYSKRAIGLHPMFKDSVKNLENKNLVITPVDHEKQKEEVDFIQQVFGETKLRIRILSPEIHDKITSFNQAGVHLILLAYGNLLKNYCRKNSIRLRDLESLNTPNSQIMNLLLGRFLETKNYDLMWGIQNSTEESVDIRKLFEKSLLDIVKDLDSGNFEEFKSGVLATSRKFKKTRMSVESEDSDELVKHLGNFGSEKHYFDQKEKVKKILNNLKAKLEIVEDFEDISDLILKLVEEHDDMKNNYDSQDYRVAVSSALKFKTILERTVMKGKRRWQGSVKENYGMFEEIDELINEFIESGKRLSELSEIVDD